MKTKKHYGSEFKVRILREHLENQISIGKISEEHKINPNVLYKWKKELFEGALRFFSRETERRDQKVEKKYKILEEQLQKKNNLISELVSDNIELKKKYNGMI
jgi:Transposase.